MAKCSRCGTSFNYEKRDGICPKCCFYNRPEGSASVDTSWMSKYGIEESGFRPPKFQSEHDGWDDVKEDTKFGGDLFAYLKKNKGEECTTEGSHVHAKSPTVVREYHKTKGNKKVERKSKSKVTVISVIAIVYILIAFITVLIEMFTF